MAVLENEFLKVEIEAKGAQLTSIYNKATKTEHLWQADSKIWGWYAPNLFPIVGALIDDELLIDGEKFSMARHGFARQSEFTLLEADGKSVNFSSPTNSSSLIKAPTMGNKFGACQPHILLSACHRCSVFASLL